MNLSPLSCITRYCTCAALVTIALVAALVPTPAAAQASYSTGYRSFTDVNDNGALDCGEPVQITTAILTNGNSPALQSTGGARCLLFLRRGNSAEGEHRGSS